MMFTKSISWHEIQNCTNSSTASMFLSASKRDWKKICTAAHFSGQDWVAEPAVGDWSLSEARVSTSAWRSLCTGTREPDYVCGHARESLHLCTWVGKYMPGDALSTCTYVYIRVLCLSKLISKWYGEFSVCTLWPQETSSHGPHKKVSRALSPKLAQVKDTVIPTLRAQQTSGDNDRS